MSRFKSNKEYSIRLTHPEFGEYYFQYSNYDYAFIFTKSLNKVAKWKTIDLVEKKIIKIISKIEGSSKIILPFGKNIDEKYKTDEYKDLIYCSMKKYFFIIKNAQSKIQYRISKENIDKLNESLLIDVENIKNLIKNNGHIEKDFMSNITNLTKDIHQYRKDYSIVKKIVSKSNPVLLDIIDSSYNFRTLKLKTLNELQIQE